jgi:hypothetical protein
MSDQKRFNINDDEVKRCRIRVSEIGAEFAVIIGNINDNGGMDSAPFFKIEKLVALATELAMIRGMQQTHALRYAAEMRVILNKRKK